MGQSTSHVCHPPISRGESINKQGLLISVIQGIRFISALAEGEGPYPSLAAAETYQSPLTDIILMLKVIVLIHDALATSCSPIRNISSGS